MTDKDLVHYDVADGVATVTLHNPDRKNAWSVAMEHQYFARLDDAAADAGVRAIVVTGAGSAFCPGMDMAALEQTAAAGELVRAGRRPMHYALSIPKPMIAAVNGACAGIGLIQALYCDLRFAARARACRRRSPAAAWARSTARRGCCRDSSASSAPSTSSSRVGRSTPRKRTRWGWSGASANRPTCSATRRRTRLTSRGGRRRARWRRSATRCTRTSTTTSRPSWARTLGIMQRMNAHADFAEGVASFTERREPVFDPLPAGFGESLRDS